MNVITNMQALDVLTAVEEGTFKRFLIVVLIGGVILATGKLENKIEIKRVEDLQEKINEIISKYKQNPLPTVNSANQLNLKINLAAIDNCFADCVTAYFNDYNSVVNDFNRINDEIISILETGDTVYNRYDFLQAHLSELDTLKLQRENCETELQNVLNAADSINETIARYAEAELPYINSINQMGLRINISEIDQCFGGCNETYKNDYNSIINSYNELSKQINSILSVVLPYEEKSAYLQEKSSLLELLWMKRKNKKTELTNVVKTADNINAIIVTYFGKPVKTESFTSTPRIKIYEKFIDKSFNALVQNYIARLNKCASDYNTINTRIKNILMTNCSVREKHRFLSSSLTELDELQRERERLFSEFLYCRNEKIPIPKDYKGVSSKLSNAFELVKNSAKNSFCNLIVKNKLSANALGRFSYNDSPFVISVGNIDYCIFGDVILMFDSLGYYMTALNHSALKITVEKRGESVDTYSKYPSQSKTGYDSKCVKYGNTTTTWLHTRIDGRPDKRYKDNPMIRHCYNTYEYGIITIRLGDAICSCTTSSQKAISEFENIVLNKKTGQYPNVIALSS